MLLKLKQRRNWDILKLQKKHVRLEQNERILVYKREEFFALVIILKFSNRKR